MELPSYEQAKTARKMLRAQVPLIRVMARLGNKFDEATINAGIERLRVHQNSQRDTKQRWRGVIDFHPVRNIPKDVEEDRDRRASLVPRDTTALRMGDPLPGYSMAERAPSIVPRRRDPLDALIFMRRALAEA